MVERYGTQEFWRKRINRRDTEEIARQNLNKMNQLCMDE